MELTNTMRCCDGCGDELPCCEPTRQPSMDLVGAWKSPKKQTSHEAFLNCIREAKIKRKEERIKSFIQNKKNKFLRAQYCSHLKEVNRLKRVKLKQYCERRNVYNAFLRETQEKTHFPDPFKVPMDVLKPTIKFPYNYPRLGKIPSLQIHKTRCVNYLGPRKKETPISKVVSQTSKVDIRPSGSGRRKPQIQVRERSENDIVVSISPERYPGYHNSAKPQVPVRETTSRNVEVFIHPEQDLEPCGSVRRKLQAPITEITGKDVEMIAHRNQDMRSHETAWRKPHIPIRARTSRNLEMFIHPEENQGPCGSERPNLRPPITERTGKDVEIIVQPKQDTRFHEYVERKLHIPIRVKSSRNVEMAIHPEENQGPCGSERPNLRPPITERTGKDVEIIVVPKQETRFHEYAGRKLHTPIRVKSSKNVEMAIHPEENQGPCGSERPNLRPPITERTGKDVEIIVLPEQGTRFHEYVERKPHIPVRNFEVSNYPERSVESFEPGGRRPHIPIHETYKRSANMSIHPARDLQPCDSGWRKPQIKISKIKTKDVEATIHPERHLEPSDSGWRKPHIPIREATGRLIEIPQKSEGNIRPCVSARIQPQEAIAETIGRDSRCHHSSKRKPQIPITGRPESTIEVSLHSEEICPCSPCEAAKPCDTQENEVKVYAPPQTPRRRRLRPMIRTHLTKPMATKFPQRGVPYSPVLRLRAGNDTSELKKVPRLRQKITHHESPTQRTNLSPEHNPNPKTTGFHCTNQQKPRGPRFRPNDNKLSRVVKRNSRHDTKNTVIVPAAEANRHDVQGGCWLGPNETPSNNQGSSATKPSVGKSKCNPSSQCKTCLVPGSMIGLKTNELVCPCSSKTHDRYQNISNHPKLTSPPHITFSKTQETTKDRKFPESVGGVEEIESETEVEGSTCLFSPCSKPLRRRFIKSGLLKRTLPSMPKRFRCAFPAKCVTLFKRVGDLKVSKSTICIPSKCSKISCPKVRCPKIPKHMKLRAPEISKCTICMPWKCSKISCPKVRCPKIPKNMKLRKRLFSNSCKIRAPKISKCTICMPWKCSKISCPKVRCPKIPKNMKLRKKLFSNSCKIRAPKFKWRRPACFKGSCDGIKVVYSRIGQSITNVHLGSCIKESCGKLKGTCSNWKMPSCDNMCPTVPKMMKNPLRKEALENMQEACANCGQITCCKPCRAFSKCSLSSCLKPFGRLPTFSCAYLKGSCLQDCTERTKELCSKCGQSSCMKMPSCMPIPPIKSCCQNVKRTISQSTCIEAPCKKFTTFSSPCLPSVSLSPCVSSCSKIKDSCLPCIHRCKRCTTNVIKNTMKSRCCQDLDNLQTGPCQKILNVNVRPVLVKGEAGSAEDVCSKKCNVATTVIMYVAKDFKIENIQTDVKDHPCKTIVHLAKASGTDSPTCPCTGTEKSEIVAPTYHSRGESSTEEELLQRKPKLIKFKRRTEHFEAKINDSSSSDSSEQETGDEQQKRLSGGAKEPVLYLTAPKTTSTTIGKSRIKDTSNSSSSETSTEDDSSLTEQKTTSRTGSSTLEKLRQRKTSLIKLKRNIGLFQQRMKNSSSSDSNEHEKGDKQEPKKTRLNDNAYESVMYLSAPKTPSTPIRNFKIKDTSTSSSSETSTEDNSSETEDDSSETEDDSSETEDDSSETEEETTSSTESSTEEEQSQRKPKSNKSKKKVDPERSKKDAHKKETEDEQKGKPASSPSDANEPVQDQHVPKGQSTPTRTTESVAAVDSSSSKVDPVQESTKDTHKQETEDEQKQKPTSIAGGANEPVQDQHVSESQSTPTRTTEIVAAVDSSSSKVDPVQDSHKQETEDEQKQKPTRIAGDANEPVQDQHVPKRQSTPTRKTESVGTIASSSSKISTKHYNSEKQKKVTIRTKSPPEEDLRERQPTVITLKRRVKPPQHNRVNDSRKQETGDERTRKPTHFGGAAYESVIYLNAPKTPSTLLGSFRINDTLNSSFLETSTEDRRSQTEQETKSGTESLTDEDLHQRKSASNKLKLSVDPSQHRMNESSSSDSHEQETEDEEVPKPTNSGGGAHESVIYLNAPKTPSTRTRTEIAGTIYSSSLATSTEDCRSQTEQDTKSGTESLTNEDLHQRKPASIKLKLSVDPSQHRMNESSSSDCHEQETEDEEVPKPTNSGDAAHESVIYLNAPKTPSTRTRTEIAGTIYSSSLETSTEDCWSQTEPETTSSTESSTLKQRVDPLQHGMNDSSSTDFHEQETGDELKPTNLGGGAYDPVQYQHIPEGPSTRTGKTEIVDAIYSSSLATSTEDCRSQTEQETTSRTESSTTEELRQRKPASIKLKLSVDPSQHRMNESSSSDSHEQETEDEQVPKPTNSGGAAHESVIYLNAPKTPSARTRTEIAGTIYSSSLETSTEDCRSLTEQDTKSGTESLTDEDLHQRKSASNKLKLSVNPSQHRMNESSSSDSHDQETEDEQVPKPTNSGDAAHESVIYLNAPKTPSTRTRRTEIAGTIYSSSLETSTSSTESSTTEELRQRKPASITLKQRVDPLQCGMNDSSSTDFHEQETAVELKPTSLGGGAYEPVQYQHVPKSQNTRTRKTEIAGTINSSSSEMSTAHYSSEKHPEVTNKIHSSKMDSKQYLKEAEEKYFISYQNEFTIWLKSLLVLERVLDVTNKASTQTLDEDSNDYDTTVREYIEHKLARIIRRIILDQTDLLLQLLSDQQIYGVVDKKFMKHLRKFLWTLMKMKDNKIPEKQNCLEEEDVKIAEAILKLLENVFIRNLNRICLSDSPHKDFVPDRNSTEQKPVSGYQTVSVEPWIYKAIMASSKEKRMKTTQIGLLCECLLMSVTEELLTCSYPDQTLL